MNTHLGQGSYVQTAQLFCWVLNINIHNMKRNTLAVFQYTFYFLKVTQPIFLLLWGLGLLIMLLYDCKEWE